MFEYVKGTDGSASFNSDRFSSAGERDRGLTCKAEIIDRLNAENEIILQHVDGNHGVLRRCGTTPRRRCRWTIDDPIPFHIRIMGSVPGKGRRVLEA